MIWLFLILTSTLPVRMHVHCIDYNHVYDETSLDFKHDQVIFWNKDRTVRGYSLVRGPVDVPDGTKFYIAREIKGETSGWWVIVTSDFYHETWTYGDPEVARRIAP